MARGRIPEERQAADKATDKPGLPICTQPQLGTTITDKAEMAAGKKAETVRMQNIREQAREGGEEEKPEGGKEEERPASRMLEQGPELEFLQFSA